MARFWNMFKQFLNDITVEPVVLLYLTAMFMEISITQDLIFTKLCFKSTNITSALECQNLTGHVRTELKDETTLWISYYSAALFAFTVVAASYIGSWSDRFSRKYTMLIPAVGSVFASSVAITYGEYIMEWPIGIILIPGFISGISGGIPGILATTFGYIADITTVENRTKRIVILEAMIFLGGTAGMMGGGALNKYLKANPVSMNSFSVVYLVELIIIVLVILYTCLRVKESVPLSSVAQQPMDSQRSILYQLFNLNHFVMSIKTVFKYRPNGTRKFILLVLGMSFLVFFSMGVQQALLYLFLTNPPLKWSPEMYSYYNGTSLGISGLALILGLPLAFHFFNVRDTTFGMLGVLSKMAGLIVLGVSTTTSLAYMCSVLFIFSEYPIPAFRSILSKIVDPDEKGKIFAFMQILQNLCFLISSQVFSQLFIASSFFPGLSFEIVALFQGIAFVMLFYVHQKLQNVQMPYEPMVVNVNPEFSAIEETT